MNVNNIDGFEVVGLSVRTTNASELNPSTAKIGQLWERFYANAGQKLSEKSKVYGVYTNYESDSKGAFDVIACSDALSTEVLLDAIKVEIVSGNYVVFSATGELPQAVLNLWTVVLNFFDSENCPYERSYTTDFEYYKSNTEVEIFISLK
ncbi:AraC family transcriptional regulator [Vibrio cholerae]|uniref:GyrI-like domain-containing protein n=1 Tax=Vibrio cholerae TaxID=666 RepID=UPI00308090FA|nr:AraC family transcriptional regulator [Vibrio cholerae]